MMYANPSGRLIYEWSWRLQLPQSTSGATLRVPTTAIMPPAYVESPDRIEDREQHQRQEALQ